MLVRKGNCAVYMSTETKRPVKIKSSYLFDVVYDTFGWRIGSVIALDLKWKLKSDSSNIISHVSIHKCIENLIFVNQFVLADF